MDPLTLLRDYTIGNLLDKIVRVKDEFRFGADYSFPAAVETAYRSKNVQQTRRYSLETLVHFITNQHLKHTEYIQDARARRIPAVTLPDRKPLLDYLTGKVQSSDSIVPVDFHSSQVTNLDLNVKQDASDGTGLESVDNLTELIRVRERPIKDREAMLVSKKRDFYSALTAATKRDEERQRTEALQRKDNIVAKNRIESRGFGGEEATKMRKIGEGVPIILVPSALSTLITMYNVKEFLEDGVFIPTEEKMKQMKGGKPECVTVQKKFSRDRVVTAYEVRDKPSSLKRDDWDRVVAVFVLGKDWQFKDWPFKDHLEIFNKVVGFYVRFEDASLESAKTVMQWNVKIISISKHKRHQDRAAALEVWDKLEQFMRSRSS
ncbi:protein CDC73 homolog [Andrographis paniculata]|uniref:protein CDC73 homolog n=1 Tax=Andrographis paniculata TaxID=175694 RepID=UPI0021E6DB14|nr:protein CDC73 homolog [Andrographis paniculata]